MVVLSVARCELCVVCLMVGVRGVLCVACGSLFVVCRFLFVVR